MKALNATVSSGGWHTEEDACYCDTTRRQYTPDYPVGPSVKKWHGGITSPPTTTAAGS
ncbi:hypothetical protein MGG_15552 [Pyricularia oryzae 70-15]|uniref:Uncharacterized protein n=1 Tax=Pyricularia oryzae (strain 70-15 / ATCC MYA-4617 / FGSC 8958) TaxID=242507 RepID=G4MTA8_PYRO7|nr:uncharacterized protein MGG_15552 [Pyricularia oryzae 70-15]EHA53854.1 hypothetical protein MGG_15552 [Pyricularia oryzae 70-15]